MHPNTQNFTGLKTNIDPEEDYTPAKHLLFHLLQFLFLLAVHLFRKEFIACMKYTTQHLVMKSGEERRGGVGSLREVNKYLLYQLNTMVTFLLKLS